MTTSDERREALGEAARELRAQATRRFSMYGPNDVRGAALWDAGCHIDPNDHDALGAGPMSDRVDRFRLAWLSAWRGRAEARYDADVWRRLAGNKPKGADDE